MFKEIFKMFKISLGVLSIYALILLALSLYTAYISNKKDLECRQVIDYIMQQQKRGI